MDKRRKGGDKMTLREKITERKYRNWTRAYDSYQKIWILIRRLDPDPHGTWNDRWKIKEPSEILYSRRGCLPLYITIPE